MAGPQGDGQAVVGKVAAQLRQEEAGLHLVGKLVAPWLPLLGHERSQLVGQLP